MKEKRIAIFILLLVVSGVEVASLLTRLKMAEVSFGSMIQEGVLLTHVVLLAYFASVVFKQEGWTFHKKLMMILLLLVCFPIAAFYLLWRESR